MNYLGIDPGASGGLVCLTDDGKLPRFSSMPDSEKEIWKWFDGIDHQHTFAVIEQVRGYMGQPKGRREGDKEVFQPGSAMFNFGWSYGGLRMALIGHGIDFVAVDPSVWQRGLGISPRRRTEQKGPWKSRLKDVAQAMYPRLKVTLKVADALLLAAYCKVINGDGDARKLC